MGEYHRSFTHGLARTGLLPSSMHVWTKMKVGFLIVILLLHAFVFLYTRHDDRQTHHRSMTPGD
jgi:hypothetical protein